MGVDGLFSLSKCKLAAIPKLYPFSLLLGKNKDHFNFVCLINKLWQSYGISIKYENKTKSS